MSLFDWRRSHHWLRGFSDAQACKPAVPQDERYAEAYQRGYASGTLTYPSGLCPE